MVMLHAIVDDIRTREKKGIKWNADINEDDLA
jgi:hypothetical protein